MTVAEWDWVFADTLLADIGTEMVQVDGIDDLPDLETSDSNRTGTDGEWSGLDFARGRTVTLTMDTVAATDDAMVVNINALKALFQVRRASVAALQYRPGGDVARHIECRARRRSIPFDYTRITRLVRSTVQLRANDPRIYADDQSSGSADVAAATTGVEFDATPDFDFGGAASGGTINAANVGDFPAPWTATIVGPLTNPRLTLAATGEQVSLVGDVELGDVVSLDSLARSILLNGSASRYEWLEAGSVWFDLAPGDNEVQFAADAGTGTCSLSWRSTWI